MQLTVSVLALDSMPLVAAQYWSFSPSMFEQSCMWECYQDLNTQDDINGKCGPDDKDRRTCMCASFKASDAYSCVSKCPQSQKDTFAAYMDDICPDVFGGSDDETPSSTVDPSSSSAVKSASDETAAATGGAVVHEVPVFVAGLVAAWLI